MQHDDSTTRRAVLAAAAGGAAVAASAPARAQQPRAKGPLVWLDMDQQALDDAYDQIVYAPNREQVTKRRISNSERARAVIGAPERVAYGATEIEKLDIYRTRQANAPVNIFIHGGAWRANRAADYACLAEPFVKAGAHYVILDFTNVDDAGGSLFPMVEQVRRAVAWVYNNAKSFGGDPNRIYIAGRSSGSHLGGCVLITDWAKDFGLPADLVKGALLSSGMYDLKPVRLSKRGAYVKFTDGMEEKLSTQRHLARINCPVVLAHGTCETPEFQRQTREFAAALKAAAKPVTLIVGEGYNHFEIPETMASPYGLLGRAVLELMGLAKV